MSHEGYASAKDAIESGAEIRDDIPGIDRIEEERIEAEQEEDDYQKHLAQDWQADSEAPRI